VDRFDALTPLVEWVEAGTAPDKIIAARQEDEAVTMTRPLCPYPQVARHKGSGSPNQASSFVCTDP
jgi:feruloyl esterase